jgi:hypothetical protein
VQTGIYHAATLKLQRNFSAGLTYLVSYTFSKAIDTGSIRAERALSDFHQGQRIATSLLGSRRSGREMPACTRVESPTTSWADGRWAQF